MTRVIVYIPSVRNGCWFISTSGLAKAFEWENVLPVGSAISFPGTAHRAEINQYVWDDANSCLIAYANLNFQGDFDAFMERLKFFGWKTNLESCYDASYAINSTNQQ